MSKNLVGSISKVAHRFYEQGGDIVITSDIWERDDEYPKKYRPHVGYDYRARSPLNLVAPFDSVVISVRTTLGSTYGRQVFLWNPILNVTAHYAHLSSVKVEVGQPVPKGNVIGVSGRSGENENSYDAHLHFGLSRGKITNAGNKGTYLGDVWLDVELFDFDTVIENGIKWHNEKGVYTPSVNVNERIEPTTDSNVTKTIVKGTKLNYVAWANNGAYTWFKLENGNYIAYGERGVEIYGYDSNSNKQPGLINKPADKPVEKPKPTRVGKTLVVRAKDYKKDKFYAYEDKACTKPLAPWGVKTKDLYFKIIKDFDPVFECAKDPRTAMNGINSVFIKYEPGIGFD